MSAQKLEAYLARLYTDENARRRFLAEPEGEAQQAGLNRQEAAALKAVDRVGLELAAASFARKRAAKSHTTKRRSLSEWLGKR